MTSLATTFFVRDQKQSNSGLDLTLAASPIKTHILKAWLVSYPNQNEAKFLLEGFQFGFRIPFIGSRQGRQAKNHNSALRQPQVVLQKLTEEVRAGRVAGPFPTPPVPNLVVSPIGLVPKSSPGEFRLIFDLSFPKDSSVNSGIPEEFASVQYTPFDAVTELVKHEGQGSYLVKVDIKSAFRLLPISPEDFSLLGMHFAGKYFVDKCLPFGLSVSCALFESFSRFLEWCLRKTADSEQIIHYLDDFCGCARSKENATLLLATILSTFAELGVPVATEKVEGPATTIKYLGLEVNTTTMQVRIPADKLSDLKQLISAFLDKHNKKVSLREMQSLIGKLAFACRAVVPGRAFCRRLIDSTIGVRQPHHKIRISAAIREDLLVWDHFLDCFNGTTIILEDQWQDNSMLNLYTDAAGGLGFGAFFQGHWTYGVWPWLEQTKADITFLELVPIVVSLHLWGSLFSNKKIMFHCDNEAVVAIINKQTTRSKPVMHLVRLLVSVCLSHNILFKAKHIPGCHNNIADALSRLQFARFRALAPDADHSPAVIPPHLWQQLRPKSTDF